jgi:predicted negative regulator of RcsB-dependent stress response
MSAMDLHEQEQMEAIKAFWAKWGLSLAVALVAAVVGYLGMQGWGSWKASNAIKVSDAYGEVDVAFKAKDAVKTRAAAEKLAAEHPSDPLASRAMLLAAKAAFDANDLANCKKALDWVLAHSKENPILDAANLRLAALLIDQKQFDAALALVKSAKTTGFTALFSDTRGDILSLKGDKAGAKTAWLEAKSKLEKDAPLKALLDIKLTSLGA